MSLSALNLRVQLPLFEGPLALLLYLIRKEEMDIMDIKIHQITHQYLEYVKMMREMDLEVAGEFVSMAATLIQIKSQMLLPYYNEQGEEIVEEDPRKVLVQKLIEYQKYQEAAALLTERPWLGRDVYPRGIREKFDFQEPEMDMEENALFSLIATFRKVIRAAEKRVHKVAKKLQSIASRISEMKSDLVLNVKIPLRSLLKKVDERRSELLITFLSSLEMAKMGFVKLFQSDTFEEIYIEAVRNLEDLSLSRVEEYDTNPEDVLQKMEEKVVIALSDESADNTQSLRILEGEEEFEEESILFGSDESQDVATDDDITNAELELGLDPLKA
jgi:segregation and condensation protein A